MKVLLFDIDGTLILTGGAGLRAMNEAFYRLYDIHDGFAGLNLAGMTDTSIIRGVFQKYEIDLTRERLVDYKALYCILLRDEIAVPSDQKCIMPGVAELLQALSEREDVYIGLLTGNWQNSGYVKLVHFGLDFYFSFGAFSDDSEIRNELLPFALKRLQEQYDVTPKPEDVFVIGDTPADIHCAKPHGSKSMAVGAAHYSVEQLEAHNPDFCFPDLTDTETLVEILG